MTDVPQTQRRLFLRILVIAALVAVLLLALYGARIAVLMAFADEGDVPPVSVFPAVPSAATVVGEDTMCASGGCWVELVVRPAPGQTPLDLAEAMGVNDTLRLDGSFWDPRTIEIDSDADSTVRDVTVIARYATG